MEQKQFDEVVEKLGQQAAEKIKALFDEHKTGALTLEQVEEKLKGIKGEDLTIQGKSIADILKAQGEEIAKLKDNGGEPVGYKSIGHTFKDAVDKNKENWETAVKGKKGVFAFETKDAATVTRTTLPTSPSSFVPSQELRPGYVPYRTNEPIMLQLANVLTTTKGVVNWVDETAGEGDAAWTAEGTAKPLVDVNVTVRSTTVQKVTAFGKASEEALDDIDFLASLYEGRMKNKVNLKIDDGLMNGDGTSNTPTGLDYYAPAFTNTEMNDSVVNPNYFDALGAAATQILRANFQATAVLINPVDWFKMMHTKDAEERYVLMSLQMSNGSFLDMVAIKSNQATVGEFKMGDFRYFNVAIREALRHEMGWEGTDFKDNTVSMRTEARLCAWVSTNERLAFCVDTYANVIDAIAGPVQE